LFLLQPDGRTHGHASARCIHYLGGETVTKASQRVLNQRRRARQMSSADRWWIVILGGGAIITVALIVYLLTPKQITLLAGVNQYDNLSRDHSDLPQTYAQIPPVGGTHNPIWQNCGIYDQPVHNENAVHSLEHGAVWITYQPDLPAAVVQHLRDLVRGHTHVLLSPYPGLPKPVVASAWGLQLPLDDPNDARLPLFITRYEQGPQTPEPGAACDGGIGGAIAQ
jgi:hypothetical protein